MAAMQVKQKDIKNFSCCTSDVVDITHYSSSQLQVLNEKEKFLELIAYSIGVYGCNGKVWLGFETKTFYVCYSRTLAIFGI